jgi:hypothetical protein
MKRWLEDDEAAPELRLLLEASRGSRPLDGTARARSRQRITKLAAIPAAAGTFFWLQQFAIGAGFGTAVSVGLAAANGSFTRSHVAVSAVARPVASVRAPLPVRRTSRTLEPAESASATSTATAPIALMPSEMNAPPRAELSARPEASAKSEPPVTAEVALLEQARRALASDPGRALGLLAEHAERFPHGTLGVEREVLAVDALVRTSQRTEAEARAARLRASAPGNLYEQRLERILGEDK